MPSGIGDTPLQVSWKADKAMAQMERAAQYITSAYTASTPLTSHSATLFITFVSGTRAAVAEILKDLGNLGSIYTTPHELALGNNGLGVIPTMIDYLGRKRHFPGSQLQFGIVGKFSWPWLMLYLLTERTSSVRLCDRYPGHDRCTAGARQSASLFEARWSGPAAHGFCGRPRWRRVM